MLLVQILVKEKIRPGVLTHILVLIGVDRTAVKLFEAVIVAVQHIRIDGKGIVAADNCVLCVHSFQAFQHGVYVGLQKVLELLVVGLVLKDSGKDLPCGAGCERRPA